MKIKARLVAGGHQQERSLYEDVSSPTVTTAGVFTILSVAVQYDLALATADVTGAFLEAQMPDEEEVYMKIDSEVTDILVNI